MNIGVVTVIISLSFFICLAVGVPVVISLFGTAMFFSLIFLGPKSLYTIFTSTYSSMTKEVFVAIPMFVLMAEIIKYSGMASSLYNAMYKWTGQIRGGLAIATVIICTLLAALTGLAALGVLSMGVIALPEMLKRGYDKKIAIGCIPAGGALGPLIPPSVPMIVTAAVAQLSVGKMFIGGIVPGLMIATLYCFYIAVRCFFNPGLAPSLPAEERASFKEKLNSLRSVILPIILVIIVLGSIYTGASTPTEASGVGAAGAIICALIMRRLRWQDLKDSLSSTVKTSGMVVWLMAGGTCFGSLLSAVGISQWIETAMTALPVSPLIVIIIMQTIAFLLGMFIDQATITVICIPLFIPVVISLGFDPLWFCLLFSINVIIGYITPPFGFNLFFVKSLCSDDISMGLIYRSVVPYIIVDVFVMVLCFIFPGILTWLPNAL